MLSSRFNPVVCLFLVTLLLALEISYTAIVEAQSGCPTVVWVGGSGLEMQWMSSIPETGRTFALAVTATGS
jgi:hypothetical protein